MKIFGPGDRKNQRSRHSGAHDPASQRVEEEPRSSRAPLAIYPVEI